MLAAAQGTRRTKARSRWHLGSVAHCRERTSVPLFALPRSRCRAQGAALSGYLLCSWPKRREMCNGGMVRLIVRAKLGSRCWFRDRFRRIGSRILPRLVPYQRNARFFCPSCGILPSVMLSKSSAHRGSLWPVVSRSRPRPGRSVPQGHGRRSPTPAPSRGTGLGPMLAARPGRLR